MAYIGYDGRAADIKKLDSIAGLFNSVTTSFPATVNGVPLAMSSATSVLISLGGVIQEAYTDYNAIGSNLVFVVPPAAGTNFFGVSLGVSISIGTVGDNTITNAKLGETIAIAKGGTGATTADAALNNLGAGAVGKAVFTSSTQSNARTQLGLGDASTRAVGTSDGNVVQVITGGKLPILDGSNLTGINSGKLIGVQQFFYSATYTPTPGTTFVLLEGRGGGGNGGRGGNGNSSGSGGGGGGGGAASALMRMVVNNSVSQTITIGGATSTKFGSLATFPAGANGVAGGDWNATGGAGGTASGFDNLSIAGLSGTSGQSVNQGGPWGMGGSGGGFGAGNGGSGVSGSPGSSGSVRGTGGGGGTGGQGNGVGGFGGTGGAGAPGYLIVYEFSG